MAAEVGNFPIRHPPSSFIVTPVRTRLAGSVFAVCLALAGAARAEDVPPPLTADQAKAAIDAPKKDEKSGGAGGGGMEDMY